MREFIDGMTSRIQRATCQQVRLGQPLLHDPLTDTITSVRSPRRSAHLQDALSQLAV